MFVSWLQPRKATAKRAPDTAWAEPAILVKHRISELLLSLGWTELAEILSFPRVIVSSSHTAVTSHGRFRCLRGNINPEGVSMFEPRGAAGLVPEACR